MSNINLQKKYEEYIRRTPKNKKIHSIAKKYLPGGDTRSIAYFHPYPIFMARGKGCYIYDADGNSYIDFLNNYTSLIHGHAHPKIIEAVKSQLTKGWACPAGLEGQHELAEIMCERFPSLDKVRFCNSGTEATMFAMRAAMAYTGREKILKMEGGYHGTCPSFEVSVHPDLEKAGPPDRPVSVPETLGIQTNAVKDTLVTPFNNKEVTEKIVRENKDSLAAIIVEPIMGVAGAIPPKDGYLEFLREITHKYNILLIFDEVQAARLSKGGGQEFFGVTPDLSAFGKIVGGGFPVGAFGGPDEIMELFSPEREGFIPHSGTFNGNAITMVAGIAAMKLLTQAAIDKINSLGTQLKNKIEKIFEEERIIGQVTGAGSLYNVHFTSEEVVDYRSAETSDKEARKYLHISLLNKGIFIAPRGFFNLSTPLTKKEIVRFAESVPIEGLASV